MADNLLDKASILLTPTAYNDGSMLSVKPENGDGDFTFSRGSAATRVNAQGLVENVQIISSELVSNGNFSQIGTEEVLNGNFSQEGSELVTNGDFSNGLTNWSVNGGSYATIVDGALNSNNTENGNWYAENISQNISFVNGKTYKVAFKAKNISGDLNLRLTQGANVIYTTNLTSSFVDYEVYYTANADNDSVRIFCNDSVGQFQIDNVSVKEVGQNWTISSGASVGEDKLNIDASAFDFFASQTALTNGLIYKVTLDAEVTSGDLLLYTGVQFGTISSSGSYTFYTTSDSTQIRFRSGGSGLTGSITNISVKEVAQDWTLGTGWSIDQANSKAVFDYDSSIQKIYTSNLVLNSNSNYKLSFEIKDILSGTPSIFIANSGGSVGYNGNYTDYSEGVYTFTFSPSSNQTSLAFFSRFSDFSITNISLKEITDDTDIPRINYSGFSYQDSLGSELVVNGDFATDSNWDKLSGATISNGQANLIFNGLGNPAIKQNMSISVGKTYKFVFYVTEWISGNLEVFVSSDTRSGFITINGVGQYETILKINTVSDVRFVGNGTASNFSIDNVSVKEVTGQEVVPDSGCGNWLLEPQSTNLIPYSEDFSQSFYNKDSSVSVGGSNNTSPSGDMNATQINVTDNGRIYSNMSSLTYYSSVFIKAGTFSYFKFAGINVDLVSETIVNGKIEPYGNGWFRISVPFTGTRPFQIQAYPDATYSSHTTSGNYYIWGAQLEQQSYATSYIPTNGSIATRLADVATNSGNASLINSTEGVLYAEIAALAKDSSYKLISLKTIDYNNRIEIGIGINNKIHVYLVSNSTQLIGYVSQDFTIDEVFKVALKWSNTNGCTLYINGSQITTVGNSTFSALDFNALDFNNFFGNPFYGKTKAVAVYKETLTDAELQSLTTI